MKNNIIVSLRLTLVCLVFFSGVYTFFVYGISKLVPAQVVFKKTSQGFYENLGQSFTDDKYFYSRPSAVNYNAAGSAGSNKGPSNPAYLIELQAKIDTFLTHNPEVKMDEIPVDLITASGSGLDPHISVQAANVQVKRIAKIRNMDESDVYQLINQQIEKPMLELFGPEKINLLKLNLALDNLK